MAKKISDLAAAAAITGAELLELVQGGANVKGAAGSLLPPGYIEGLQLKWVSANALTVTTGAAYIPSLGRVVRLSADVAKAGLVLTANTWYHVYLWLNGPNLDIEIVSTAPSAPYNGAARAKTGDTTRRYLGSARTDSGGLIIEFTQYAQVTRYLTGGGAPFRVVSNGQATTRTNVDISTFVPATAATTIVKAQNSSTGAQGLIVDSGGSGLTGLTGFFIVAQPGTQLIDAIPTMGSSNLQYLWTTAPVSQGAFIDILGYTVER